MESLGSKVGGAHSGREFNTAAALSIRPTGRAVAVDAALGSAAVPAVPTAGEAPIAPQEGGGRARGKGMRGMPIPNMAATSGAKWKRYKDEVDFQHGLVDLSPEE